MQTNSDPDSWTMQMDTILQKYDPEIQDLVIGGDTNATIFRVPIPLREVNEKSYIPKFFSFGLYNHDTRERSSLDTFRLDFVKIFMNITKKQWDGICSEVVGDSVEKLEKLVKNYGDFQLKYRVDEITKSLAMDAVFVVCFLQGDHQRVCHMNECPSLPPLNEEMKKATLRPLVHLIRLDIFKFENQIPLSLIQNVVNMMNHAFPKRPDGDPFQKFLGDAVDLINCLPGKDKFRSDVLKQSLDLKSCSHLLHCLYSAICYKKSTSSVEGSTAAHAEAQPAPAPSDQRFSLWHFVRTCLASICTVGNRGSGERATGDGRATAHGQGQAVGRQEGNSAGDHADVAGQASAARDIEQVLETVRESGLNAQQSDTGGGGVHAAQVPPVPATVDSNRETALQRNTPENANLGSDEDNAAGRATEITVQNDIYGGSGRPEGQAHPTPTSDSAHVPPAPTTASDQDNAAQRNNGGGGVPGATHPTQRKRKHNHSLHIPTVTQLKEVGIRVSVGSGKFVTNWISEVKFQSRWYGGTLYLPQFSVYDETEILFRNLLAYEYVVEKKQALISYIHLMDNLINTEEDVKLMRESGVLTNNSLGSDELLAEMWNKMLIGIVVGLNKPYQDVFDNIKKHYDSKWNKLFAEFQGLYLRRPWLFGGVVLLLLTALATFVATVYTILQYYYGNKNM